MHPSSGRRPSTAVLILACSVFALLVLSAYFQPRRGGVDEISAYNPVYMKHTAGRMSHPSHGFHDGMSSHPPVHVGLIWFFERLGLTRFYAEPLPALLWLALCVVLAAWSPFSEPLKAGLLTALMAPLALIQGHQWTDGWWGSRPDWHVFAAWMCGLLLLEWGRVAQWNGRLLFAGAFVLTYAAGVHYSAGPAFLGVLVYVVWAFLRLPRAGARRAAAALLGGGLLFGLPYLLLFVLPNLEGIRGTYGHNRGLGDPLGGFRYKLHYYREFIEYGGPWTAWVHRLAAAGVPLLAQSGAILLWIPAARGIWLASLPLQAFVYFVVSHTQAYYLAPEYGMITLALVTGGVLMAERTSSRALTIVAMLAPAAYLALASPEWREDWPPRLPAYHEADIARAVGKEMLGDEARVGYRMSLWYLSGEARSYMIDQDVHKAQGGVKVKLLEYFRVFDAVSTNAHFANLGTTLPGLSEAELFASGMLHLRGFYFAQDDVDFGYLLLAAEPPARLQGYARQGGRLFRFVESADGDQVFRAAVCPAGQLPGMRAAARWLYFLGIPEAGTYGTRRGLAVTITSLQQANPLAAGCEAKAALSGRLEEVNTEALVGKLRRRDRPIRFYRDIEALAWPDRAELARRVYGMPPPAMIEHRDAARLQEAIAASSLAEVRKGPPVVSRMPAGIGQYGAAVPLARRPADGPCWFDMAFRVREGVITFGFREKGKDQFLHESRPFLAGDFPRDAFVEVPNCGRVDEVVLRGALAAQPSVAELTGMTVWTAGAGR